MDSAHPGPRARPRIPGLLPFIAILIVLGCSRDQLLVRRGPISLPADGRVHPLATVSRPNHRTLRAPSISAASPQLLIAPQADDVIALLVRSPVLPGSAQLHFSWREHRYTLNVRYVEDDADSRRDGLPDALHLHSPEDRAAFRAWFDALAEQEAALPDDKLPPEIDDCAALLRFAYREALVQHDDRWLAAQADPGRFAPLVSVTQYQYPRTALGLNLFRVAPGSFTSADLTSGAFAQFADAHALLSLNTYRVSRDIRNALPGDLLFFRQLEQNSQYHSMVVAGAHADWVIYHTGPIGKQKGEIRRVSTEDLLRHPDTRWRPVPGNTNFLGVYRWNLLHDGD